MEMLEFTPEIGQVGMRLDQFLADKMAGYSRSELQKLCENGYVLINKRPANKSHKLSVCDNVIVSITEKSATALYMMDIPLDILYEDEHLLVVNKPKGMVVHPGAGNEQDTLVNALLHHCKGKLPANNADNRPGIVHRIDKNTSGLLVVAKSDLAYESLSQQVKAKEFTREYRAVVYGNIRQDTGRIELPIARNPIHRKKMCVSLANGRQAATGFEVIERYTGYTQLSLRLETGRTHQIRVHLAHIGHPVAGDDVYGPKKAIKSLMGQCLHAHTLGFVHPQSNEYMQFSQPLPNYFTAFVKTLTVK